MIKLKQKGESKLYRIKGVGATKTDDILERAQMDYIKGRACGSDLDLPERGFPGNGRALPSWLDDAHQCAYFSYYPSVADKRWMEEKERSYVARISKQDNPDASLEVGR